MPMACLKRGTLLFACIALSACSKLTEPPKQEAIQTEPTGSAEVNKANAPGQPSGKPAEQPKPAEPVARPSVAAEPEPPSNEKLEVKDLVVGKGTEAKKGDAVKVHYVGTLPDGKEFDSSKKHNQPFDFELGAGRVIKGWDQGVAGMKIGGKRKLTVPPSLGYGARGFPPVIPPNSTLIFEVELLEVKKK